MSISVAILLFAHWLLTLTIRHFDPCRRACRRLPSDDSHEDDDVRSDDFTPKAAADANISLYCEICTVISGDKKDVYDRCVKGCCDACEECHEKNMCLNVAQDAKSENGESKTKVTTGKKRNRKPEKRRRDVESESTTAPPAPLIHRQERDDEDDDVPSCDSPARVLFKKRRDKKRRSGWTFSDDDSEADSAGAGDDPLPSPSSSPSSPPQASAGLFQRVMSGATSLYKQLS